MGNIRTSLSHPLVIDEVGVPGYEGRIGMTMLPGRCSTESLYGNIWHRDLETDLTAIRALDPALLISLNESHEFARLGVPDFERTLSTSGLAWRHLPIRDAGVPDVAFERAWLVVGAEARALLRAGELVIIHCRAGLGRTGMIAARLLVELGDTPREAIAAIRQARPHTIETPEQLSYVSKIVTGA